MNRLMVVLYKTQKNIDKSTITLLQRISHHDDAIW